MVRRIGPAVLRHRGFLALGAVHALVFWTLLGSGSAWTTSSLECAAGGMADVMLSGGTWSPLDTFQGALGGMFTSALLGLPLFAVFGIGPFTTQLLAYLGAFVLLLVVYCLLDRNESRAAALLATAALAFAPPVLVHPSAVLGNWHWTQLIFDYGLVLFAFELLRRSRPLYSWALFGCLCGLAVFHCMGSLPFTGVAVLIALVGSWPGRSRLLVMIGGGLVGLAPFLYKLKFHRPFGYPVGPDEQTVSRLTTFDLDLSRLPDLVYPELPWGLHFHDAMTSWPGPPGWTLALIWTALAWAGVLLLIASLLGRPQDAAAGGRRLRIAAVPLLFIGVFATAYVLLNGQLEMFPEEFTYVRERGSRNLPMLLAALVVGAAIGWTRLAARFGGRWRSLILGIALLPAGAGILGMAALVERDGPSELRSFSSYRASCIDVLGVFAAATLKGHSWDAVTACDGLEGESRRRQCRIGAAWGTGFGSVILSGGRMSDSATAERGPRFIVATESLEVCDRLSPDLRPDCHFGIGWSVGANNWGRDDWPISACDSLSVEVERDECWRGVGFPLGDHLQARPKQMGKALARAPWPQRLLVAEGLGLAVGRTYSERDWAMSICERMGGHGAAPCRVGVERAFSSR